MYLGIIIDCISILFQESYTYKDPITEFVECLYVNFDFDSAQKKLRECESVSNHFQQPHSQQLTSVTIQRSSEEL